MCRHSLLLQVTNENMSSSYFSVAWNKIDINIHQFGFHLTKTSVQKSTHTACQLNFKCIFYCRLLLPVQESVNYPLISGRGAPAPDLEGQQVLHSAEARPAPRSARRRTGITARHGTLVQARSS
uniref:Uncharacterized protein n=1 Tax=Aegilops tauschii subsp. strangulata TaxID=200361 RepID=A0A453BLU8_AEGTS